MLIKFKGATMKKEEFADKLAEIFNVEATEGFCDAMYETLKFLNEYLKVQVSMWQESGDYFDYRVAKMNISTTQYERESIDFDINPDLYYGITQRIFKGETNGK